LNVSYGPSGKQKLDIYGTNLPRNSPVYIFVHGGYWKEPAVSKNNSAHMAKNLVEEGVKVMIVDYELCPDVTLQEMVDQIKKCFSWIADYIQKNQVKKILVSGHSSGSHLFSFGLSKEFYAKISPDVEVNAIYLSGIYYLDELRYLKTSNLNNVLSLTDSNLIELSPMHTDLSYMRGHKGKIFVCAAVEESEMFR
jgi:arylformamidase